jgi:hypothetical protein
MRPQLIGTKVKRIQFVAPLIGEEMARVIAVRVAGNVEELLALWLAAIEEVRGGKAIAPQGSKSSTE